MEKHERIGRIFKALHSKSVLRSMTSDEQSIILLEGERLSGSVHEYAKWMNKYGLYNIKVELYYLEKGM